MSLVWQGRIVFGHCLSPFLLRYWVYGYDGFSLWPWPLWGWTIEFYAKAGGPTHGHGNDSQEDGPGTPACLWADGRTALGHLPSVPVPPAVEYLIPIGVLQGIDRVIPVDVYVQVVRQDLSPTDHWWDPAYSRMIGNESVRRHEILKSTKNWWRIHDQIIWHWRTKKFCTYSSRLRWYCRSYSRFLWRRMRWSANTAIVQLS